MVFAGAANEQVSCAVAEAESGSTGSGAHAKVDFRIVAVRRRAHRPAQAPVALRFRRRLEERKLSAHFHRVTGTATQVFD